MFFYSGLAKRLVTAGIACSGLLAVSAITPAAAQTIVVQGTQRVDAETIRSYFRGTDQGRINDAVKELYATGLFSDVRVIREGGRIVVRVTENQSINRIAFEGNSRLKSAMLSKEVQSRSRGAYNPATVEADIQRIKDIYRRAGPVDWRGTKSASIRASTKAPGALPASRPRSSAAARRPISLARCRTVVSGGAMERAKSRSAKPTTEMSPGTARPSSAAA